MSAALEAAVVPRCAVAARERQDPVRATAAPARSWLLVEQPGAWGREALTDSHLDPAVGAAVTRRLRDGGGRAVLVRRAGRTLAGAPRRWGLADSRPGRARTWWGDLRRDRDLLDLPLDEPDAFEALHAPSSTEPVYLTCTHGRHDRCCAQDGRPVALALADERPEHAWECSHLGGCRFAGNVVVLPWGLAYGGVGPEDVPALVAATEAGRIVTPLLRGRSSLTPAEQAAQDFARAELGIDGVEDLAPLSTVPAPEAGGDTWRVGLTGPGGPDGDAVVCTVRARPSAGRARMTCSARVESPQRVWDLLALDAGPAGPARGDTAVPPVT